MIRVLHVFNLMDNGGIEHFVMDRYRKINRDRVQFDFLVTSGEKGYFENEIKSLGGKIYYTDSFTKNPLKVFFQIKKIVNDNHYDIVHRHTGNAIGYFDLRAAKAGGAKQLIIHSHNNNAGKIFLHSISKKLLAFDCIRLACSESAGKWLFGTQSFQIMNNAIDTGAYSFNKEKRTFFREKYGIANDTFVIGNIGRLDYQKNHEFLVDILNETLKFRPNTCLMCIGDGGLKQTITEKAIGLGIMQHLILTGSVDNVNELINCFDVFCLPSKYEGLPLTIIEAQSNGLKCFASADRVTSECDLTGNVEFIPLDESAHNWAKFICEADLNRDPHAIEKVKNKGYDLTESAKQLEAFYEEIEK